MKASAPSSLSAPLLAPSVLALDQAKPDGVEAARHFAEPILSQYTLSSGENAFAHAHSVVELVREIGATSEMQAAVYLACASDQLVKPKELIANIADEDVVSLALETHKIFQLQRQAQSHSLTSALDHVHVDKVRRLLLAFSRDLRVVMLLMASHLQSLKYAASLKRSGFEPLARETLRIFAPLANRLGIWQIKWELEDLAFRILEPSTYKQVAEQLEFKRSERETEIARLRDDLQAGLSKQGILAQVQGRPKNIYSIVKKMRGKSLGFDQVHDLRAFRIIVESVADCYSALSWVHSQMQAIDHEFDDYIAKPKNNGYQSLHTVVKDRQERILEIQIRTSEMHAHAEFGVAAHWAYKEAGVKGYSGISASAEQAQKMAVLRQLLAWERDVSQDPDESGFRGVHHASDDTIFVLTPDASVVELPQGATPIDFAYTVHTELGHRCRGAKVDGTLVPLSTPLLNGQTVEITLIKEGGPSRDWLNNELGFLVTHRAKSKVRAWFNAQQIKLTTARGRELVEKVLQREGRTALKLEDVAKHLGFDSSAKLFEAVGKDEFALRNLELFLRPPASPEPEEDRILKKVLRNKSNAGNGGVLVVGVDSLLTQLARCCRPAPPDLVKGFVTRGRGVSIHRVECQKFHDLALKSPDRVIEVAWGEGAHHEHHVYPVDVQVIANDRQGLLRDVSEIFAKEKMNVIGVQTQSVKEVAWMTFTIEIKEASRLQKVLGMVKTVQGVQSARRVAA